MSVQLDRITHTQIAPAETTPAGEDDFPGAKFHRERLKAKLAEHFLNSEQIVNLVAQLRTASIRRAKRAKRSLVIRHSWSKTLPRSLMVTPKGQMFFFLNHTKQINLLTGRPDPILGKGSTKRVQKAIGIDGIEYSSSSISITPKSAPHIQAELVNNEHIKGTEGLTEIFAVAQYAGKRGPKVHLISELLDCNLADFLTKRNIIKKSEQLQENEVKILLSHCIFALCRLHRKEMVHRDIKPGNLLVRLDDEGKLAAVKLNDFDISQRVSELKGIRGTRPYYSPELQICLLEKNGTGVSQSNDIWALGCVFKICLECVLLPWSHYEKGGIFRADVLEMKKTFRGAEPLREKEPISHLIWCTLDPNPETRITAEELVQRIVEIYPDLHF